MKASEVRCQLCGRNVFETGGYLTRVNEKGVPGIWECAPDCDASVSTADALMMAITGEDVTE